MKFYFVLFLAIIPYFVSAQKQGQQLIDSLLTGLIKSKEDTNKIKLLDQLSITYSNINPAEGLRLGQKAIDLSNKLNWEKGIATSMIDLGINHEATSDHSKALEYYQSALNRYEQIDDKSSIAVILANMALVYLAQSNYPKALEYDFKALDINKKLGKRKNNAAILENIGTIYFEQKEYSKTTEYYENALKIYNDLGDKESVAKNLGNTGILLASRGDYTEAVKQQLKALKIHQEIGKISSIQINLTNIGDDYNHLKDYPDALEYQLKALKISEELGNKNSIAINLGNIGETYLSMAIDSTISAGAKKPGAGREQANLYLAIHYLEKAVHICTEIHFSGPLVEFSQCLSESYFLAAAYKKAFESLKQYTVTKDSVFSLQSRTRIASMEDEREDELRKKGMLIKDKQIEINELTISRKHYQQRLYIACIILLLVVMGLVVKILYGYRRSNSALVKKETRHLLLIEEQVDRLKKTNEKLREISWIQSHVVRAPLARLMGAVHVIRDIDLDEIENKDFLESVLLSANELDDVIRSISDRTEMQNERI